MSTIDRTFTALEAMETAGDAEGVVSILADALSEFGFTAFVLSRLPRVQDGTPPSILLNGWPEGWSQRYAEAQHHLHDPLARHCMSTSAVFSWADIPQPYLEAPGARSVIDEAASFDLNDGLCVPLHTLLGVGGLSMAGPSIDLAPGARHMAQMLAFRACITVEGLASAPPAARLSARERDVLNWVAAGKTAAEIAAILNISVHTIGEHLKRIRRKLGTSNSAHSVVEALRSGEIRF